MATPASSAASGRKGIPRNLKLLNGRGPGVDSGGRPIEPPLPFERGPLVKPDHLSDDASWLWDLVVAQMAGIGLLKPLDAASLEAVCEVFARLREAVRVRQEQGLEDRNARGNPVAGWWVRVESEASREFRSWCAEYGLTPAAEKNLKSGDHDGGITENPFA
jgi:P27 family predicted phage terminase small subunit